MKAFQKLILLVSLARGLNSQKIIIGTPLAPGSVSLLTSTLQSLGDSFSSSISSVDNQGSAPTSQNLTFVRDYSLLNLLNGELTGVAGQLSGFLYGVLSGYNPATELSTAGTATYFPGLAGTLNPIQAALNALSGKYHGLPGGNPNLSQYIFSFLVGTLNLLLNLLIEAATQLSQGYLDLNTIGTVPLEKASAAFAANSQLSSNNPAQNGVPLASG